MFQKCPLCNGTGEELNPFVAHNLVTTINSVCTVCKGKKIISTVTGKPPANDSPVNDEKYKIYRTKDYSLLNEPSPMLKKLFAENKNNSDEAQDAEEDILP